MKNISTTSRSPRQRQFASDNYSGICPEAFEAIQSANHSHSPSYGDDPWTRDAADEIRRFFGVPCEVFFVFNGTAANSLSLASLCQSYHSVICHEVAHVETDECGAPEFFSNGTKLLPSHGADGKLDPAGIEALVTKRSDIHFPKPRVVSLSLPTEVGTLYTLEELRDIREAARRFHLFVHLDGARFFNAVAALGKEPREIIHALGPDVVCLGGTKAGMSLGEAVVFFNLPLASEFAYRCKQAGQLCSKMRFLSAQWTGLLAGDAWRRHAGNANARARQLREALEGLPHLGFPYPTEANSVFVCADKAAFAELHARGWKFYEFIGGAARFMCSWDTTSEDVEALAADVSAVVRGMDQPPGDAGA